MLAPPMSTAVQVEPTPCVFSQKSELWITTDSGSSSSSEIPSDEHIIDHTRPRGNSPADDESTLASDDGDNTPTIK
jgi:hypothetical protein